MPWEDIEFPGKQIKQMGWISESTCQQRLVLIVCLMHLFKPDAFWTILYPFWHIRHEFYSPTEYYTSHCGIIYLSPSYFLVSFELSKAMHFPL